MDNIFAIYKPKGPTSHDIVAKIRRITGIKKVGHAGTLDPLASGILVIAVGRQATRQLSTIVQKEKEYIATIKLGKTSTTDDNEGEKTEIKVINYPSLTLIKKTLKNFIGEIEQTPPAFSAIKIKGTPAYKSARKGTIIKLNSRKVLIKEIELIDYTYPILKIRVITGPGMYIRALARDIGRILETGAYLADLERIRVGEFTKEKTIALHKIKIYE